MKNNRKFPLMQTHLDFHTSPDIKGIGKNFSKENFQAAIKKGNLDSITVFAKCHHSMCYYPTKVGVMHPHLDFDLTGAMVDAAHEVGVRAPVYITAGWSHYDAQMHPEWHAVNKQEYQASIKHVTEPEDRTKPKPHVQWQLLCLNDGNGYTKHIYELTEEICKRYKELDGLFYDICAIGPACYCESCLKGMQEMGLNAENDDDAKKYFILKRQAFFEKCGEILKKYHPEATIFFNGCAGLYNPQYHAYQSHFEMEDLPTAWGGYDKLPLRAKYFERKNTGLIGMTGKFHLDWGEFGGFKSKDALKFEVATMALYGAGASVGDHMHPDGEMEMQTYENIGFAYRYLESIAPYCYGGDYIADIGIYISEARDANEGLSNILLENQHDFGLVTDNDFEKFDTVIFPGKCILSDEALATLEKYIDNGGKVVLLGDALVKNGKFQLDFGVKYLGKSEFDCDYIIPAEKNELLPDAPLLCNFAGHRVDAPSCQIVAESIDPYFSRTYEHFCGHKNTPHDKNSKRIPAIVKNGNIVYVSHELTYEYLAFGSIYHKRYFMLALGLVYEGGVLRVEGLGSQGRCTMIEQKDQNRYCINMVYASPVQRGKASIIEDILPVYNIKLSVKNDKTVKRVYLPLENTELKFTVNGDTVEFTVPKLHCHASIVIEY